MGSELIELIRLMNERPIAFNKHYVFLGCGINGAVMLSQLVYWADKSNDRNGWIYKTGKEWTEETGLTRREQDTARKNLKELGFIDEHKHGVPCKVHFKVNQEALYDALVNLAQKRQTDAQISQTECTKAPNLNGGKRQTNTEITTKITTDISNTHFDEFWKAYPNKKDRKRAEQKFSKINFKKNPFEKIMDNLEQLKKTDEWIKDNGKYIPMASTWINGERWNDVEAIEIVRPSNKPETPVQPRPLKVIRKNYLD